MRPIQGHAAGKIASTVTLLRRWRSENYKLAGMRPIQGHAAGKMASTVTLLRRWRSENYSALFTQDIGRRDPRLLRPMRRLLSVNDRVRKEAKRRSAADRKSVRRRHFSHGAETCAWRDPVQRGSPGSRTPARVTCSTTTLAC